MRSLISHLRYTIRLLLKSPGFTITSILILGFGIGMNTAVFSLINSVILRPLPFPHSEQLAELFMPFQNEEYMPFDYEDYTDICATQRSFESLAIFIVEDDSLTGQGAAERVTGSFVSSNMFKLTGMPFILGRPFSEDEDRLGGPRVVVLSERFWKRRFNADPKILGAMLTISGRPLEVIGVAPAQAFEWSPVDLYIPMHLARGVDFQSRAQHYFNCIGRLNHGVSSSKAQAELEGIRRGLAEQYPDTDKGYRIRVAPLLSVQTEPFSPTLWLLGAADGCLFLIAVANVVSLVLARAFERRREISIRAALGASRRRIVAELLVEGALLSSLGAAAGLLIAFWAIDIISLLCREQDLGRFHRIRFDETSMLFFAGITALSSLLFGLCPFWSLTRNKLGFTLKEEAGPTTTIGRNRQRTQTALVIGQVAVACVLVIGTGLLARSFQMTLTVPLGFNPDHVLTTRFALTDKKYGLGNDVVPDAIAPHKAEILGFYDTLLERARDLPGVASVALNSLPPFEGFFSDPFYIKGSPESEPGQTPVCATQAISTDYFRALQIPLLVGRDFNADDRIGGQPVVIIDEAMAKRFFSKDSPIGKQIEFAGELSGYKRVGYTIVGIVHHVQQYTADRPQPPFQAYFPCAQLPSLNQCLLLRTRLDPHELFPVVRKLFAAIDPDVLVAEVTTYDDLMGQLSTTRRLGVLLTSLFSGTALFLSSVGLYGILVYSVSQRAREIGVRIALGAQATDILRLVIRHGLKIFGTGLAIGILSTLLLSHSIQSVLFGVSGNDPISFGLAILVLGVTGIVACLFPALQAMRTDPIKALRE
jgi:putative ABC transport system permease protein